MSVVIRKGQTARRGQKPTSTAKATTPTPAAARVASPIPSPPELKAIGVAGGFPETVAVVARTTAALHLVTGTIDEDDENRRKVLLPFAEVRLGGGDFSTMREMNDEDDLPTLFSATMSLENLAFMLLDLTNDLRRVCTETIAIGGGELAVDQTRMAHVRYFVAHLERQARSCRLRLDQAYGEPKPD